MDKYRYTFKDISKLTGKSVSAVHGVAEKLGISGEKVVGSHGGRICEFTKSEAKRIVEYIQERQERHNDPPQR